MITKEQKDALDLLYKSGHGEIFKYGYQKTLADVTRREEAKQRAKSTVRSPQQFLRDLKLLELDLRAYNSGRNTTLKIEGLAEECQNLEEQVQKSVSLEHSHDTLAGLEKLPHQSNTHHVGIQ